MNLFTTAPSPTLCSHPVLFLRNSTVKDTKSAMEFIYTGKTVATKLQIPALIEIASELGLIGLRKSIESGVQSCGVEMFRRQVTTSKNNNINTCGSQRTIFTESSNGPAIESQEEHHDEITIKCEPPESTDENESSSSEDTLMKGEKSYRDESKNSDDSAKGLKRASSISLSQDSLTLKKCQAGNSSKSTANGIQWMGRDSEVVSNGNGDGQIQLELDKGESFVYTNEDFMDTNNMENNRDDVEESSQPSINNMYRGTGQFASHMSLLGLTGNGDFSSGVSAQGANKSQVNRNFKLSK